MREPPPFSHVCADLVGIAPARLRDRDVLSGLLIAAAGAAGFTAIEPAHVRTLPNGDSAGVLLLEGCHMTLHAFPGRGLLLLDVLAPSTQDVQKAVDVFTRRLAPATVRSETRGRG